MELKQFFMDIATILTNRSKRINTLFRIINGKGFYVVNGVEIERKEFERLFPVPLVFKVKANPDKELNWMNDEKSY